MAFDLAGLKALPGRLSDFINSDAAPVVLGGGAQAVMAKDPTSWQYQLGGLGAQLGQSNIAAKAAKRQATERQNISRLLTALLSGRGPYTEEGKPGFTTSGFKVGPDGSQTVTIKGNDLLNQSTRVDPSGQRQTGGAATTKSSTSSPTPSGNVRPVAPPMAQNPSGLLPFYLAQQTTGSAGGQGNLFGLTPEQINTIAKSDIDTSTALNQTSGQLYSNLTNQALADYYGRLPQTTPVKPTLSFSDMKINSDTGTWQYFDRVTNKLVDTGIKATGAELSGQFAPNWREAEYVDSQGVRRKGIFKDGRLVTRLGIAPEATPETGRQFGIEKDLAEIEDKITSDNHVPADIDNFNKRSEANYYYRDTSGPWYKGGKEHEKIQLPPGIKARDVYETLQKRPGMTIEELIKILGR